MAAAVRADTRILFLANPNNPTGTFCPWAEVLKLVERVPPTVLVVLNEAVRGVPARRAAFAHAGWIARFPNLVITRTLSKAYGLAGLRVGYAIADPSVAEVMNRVRQPFNVNHLAMVAARAALTDAQFIARSRAMNAAGLKQLAAGFERLGSSSFLRTATSSPSACPMPRASIVSFSRRA